MLQQEAHAIASKEAEGNGHSLADLRRELQKLDRKMADWDEKHIDGKIDEDRWQRLTEKLAREAAELRSRVSELEHREKAQAFREDQVARLGEALRDFDRTWEHLNMEERRQLVQTVIEKMTLHRAEVGFRVEMTLLGGVKREVAVPSIHRAKGDHLKPVDRLALRQLVVIWHLNEGRSRDEIAKVMGVTPDTLTHYIKGIRSIMGERDLDKIVQAAMPRVLDNLPCLKLEGRAIRRPSSEQTTLKLQDRVLLQQLADGTTYSAIAEERGVNVSTVQRHAERVYRDIGVEDREQAVQWFKDENRDASQLGAVAG